MIENQLPPEESLLGFIVRFAQYGNHGAFVQVETRHAEAFLAIYPMTQRVRRYARAYRRLVKARMAAAGRPLVRAALEHAVTAQWVFYTVDGVERLKVEANRDRAEYLRVVGQLSYDHPDVIAAFAGVPSGKGLQKWDQIRQGLEDSTGFLAITYKVLSQSVHVTYGAYQDAIHQGDDGHVALRDEPEEEAGHATLYVLAASCMLAWWLEAVCRGDTAKLRSLVDEGRELHLAHRLDQNLPEHLRRHDAGDD